MTPSIGQPLWSQEDIDYAAKQKQIADAAAQFTQPDTATAASPSPEAQAWLDQYFHTAAPQTSGYRDPNEVYNAPHPQAEAALGTVMKPMAPVVHTIQDLSKMATWNNPVTSLQDLVEQPSGQPAAAGDLPTMQEQQALSQPGQEPGLPVNADVQKGVQEALKLPSAPVPGSIADTGGNVFGQIGRLVPGDHQEGFRQVGQHIATDLPAIIATMGLGPEATAAYFGGTSAVDAADRGETPTQQLEHGAIGATVGRLLPEAGQVGSGIGAATLDVAGLAVPKAVTMASIEAASKVGHTALTSTLMELQRQADSVVSSGGLAPVTPESAAGILGMTIPMAALPSELTPYGKSMKARVAFNDYRAARADALGQTHAEVWNAVANGEDPIPALKKLVGHWNEGIEAYQPSVMTAVGEVQKSVDSANEAGGMNNEDFQNIMAAFQGKYKENMATNPALPGTSTVDVLAKKGFIKPMTKAEVEAHFNEALKYSMGDYNAAKLNTVNRLVAHLEDQLPKAMETLRNAPTEEGDTRSMAQRQSEADLDTQYNGALMKLTPYMKDAKAPNGENLLSEFIRRDVEMSNETGQPSIPKSAAAAQRYDAYRRAIVKLAETYDPTTRQGKFNPLKRMADGSVQERELQNASLEDMVATHEDGKSWLVNPEAPRKMGLQGGTALSRAQEFVVDKFNPDEATPAEATGMGQLSATKALDSEAKAQTAAAQARDLHEMYVAEAKDAGLSGKEFEDYITKREGETNRVDNSLGIDLGKTGKESYYDIALHLMQKVQDTPLADLWDQYGGKPLFGQGAASPGKFKLFKQAILADMEKNIDPGTGEQQSDSLSKAQIEFYNAWRENATTKGERPALAGTWGERRQQFRHALRLYWGQGNIDMKQFYLSMLKDKPEYVRMLTEAGGKRGPNRVVGESARVAPEGPINEFDFNPKDTNKVRPVIGNKKAWFTPENSQMYRSLLAGKNRVVDAFMGSGAMGSAARQLGFRGDIVSNEQDPRVSTALRTIQDNPGAIEDVRALVDKLQTTRTPEAFNEIVKSWPNQNIALFVGSQANFMGRGLEKSTNLVPKMDRLSSLKDLPARLEKWKAQRHQVASEDGFAMADKAGPGDLLVFDPPYLGTDTYRNNKQLSGLENVQVAINNGADVLYFNSYSPELEQQAKDMGLVTERQTVGQTDTLVAHSPTDSARTFIDPAQPEQSLQQAIQDKYGMKSTLEFDPKTNALRFIRVLTDSGTEVRFPVFVGDMVANPGGKALTEWSQPLQEMVNAYTQVVGKKPATQWTSSELTGLTNNPTRDAMQLGYNTARKLGMDHDESLDFAQNMGMMVELFKTGTDGIAKLVTPKNTLGLSVPTKAGRLTTVNIDDIIRQFPGEASRVTNEILTTIAHELSHIWDRSALAHVVGRLAGGKLPDAQAQAHAAMGATFVEWGPVVTHDFLNKVLPSILFPEGQQPIGTSLSRNLEQESTARFMELVMQGMITNSHAGEISAAGNFSYADAMKWTSDEVVDLAGYVHRDFGTYMSAVKDYYAQNPKAPGAAMITRDLSKLADLGRRFVDRTVPEVQLAKAQVGFLAGQLDTSGTAVDPTYTVRESQSASRDFTAATGEHVDPTTAAEHETVINENAPLVFGTDANGEAAKVTFEHERKQGTTLPVWSRWGSLFYQQMMRYNRQGNPMAETVMQKVNDLEKAYFRLNRTMHDPFLVYDKQGRLTYDENHPLLRVVQKKDAQSVEARGVLSELARWSNTNAKPGIERDPATGKVTLSPDVPPNISDKIGKFPNDVQQGILAGMDSLLKGSAKAADLIYNDRVESAGGRLAAMLMALDRGMNSDTAWNIAQGASEASIEFARAQGNLKALTQGTQANQALTPQVQQAIAAAQAEVTRASARYNMSMQGINTDQVGAATAFLLGRESIAKDLVQMRDFFDKRKDWFTTESRPGQFFIASTTPGGEEHYVGAKNTAHMDQITEQLTAQGHSNIRYYDRNQRGERDLFDTPDAIIESYIAKEQKAWAEVRTTLEQRLSGADMDFIDKLGYVPGAEMSKQLEQKGIKRYLQERERLPGREMTDSLSAFVDYTGRLSGSVARRSLQRQMDLHMQDPRLNNEAAFKQLVHENMDALLQPLDNKLQLARTMLTAKFLGIPNFIGPMVEMMQSVQGIMPYLIHNSDFSSGVKYYKDALMGPAKYYKLGQDFKSKRMLTTAQQKADVDPNLLSKEESTMLYYKRQNDEGGFQYGPIYSANNSRNHQMLTQMAFGLGASEPRTKMEMVSDPIYWAAQKSMFLYSTASAYNSRIAFLGALSMLYDKGVRGENLYKGAAAYQNAFTHGGGKPNSIGYVSKISNSTTRSAVGMTETLQRYAFGNTMMAMDFFDESLPGKFSTMKVTPTERSSARKAFLTSQAIQVGLAGTMGLTGAAIISALVQKAGGPDLKQAMREFWKSLAMHMGADEPHAVLMANYAQNGMVSNALGVDVSNRMTTNSILGFNSFDGFNTNEVTGVISSSIGDLWDAGKFVAQGNMVQAGKSMAPPSMRPYIQMAESQAKFGDFGVRNQKGELQATLQGKEVPEYLLGAKPYRLRSQTENKAAIKYAQDQFMQNQGQQYDDFAQQMTKGNTDAMQAFIDQRRKEDPTINAQGIKQQVAEKAWAMTHEQDPMSQGFPAGFGPRAKQIDASFGSPSAPESKLEQHVYELQHGTASPKTSPKELNASLTHDAMVDSLVKNQGMTRDEAERLLNALQKRR